MNRNISLYSYSKLLDKDYYLKMEYQASFEMKNYDKCKSVCAYHFNFLIYRTFLKRNPENFTYYDMLLKANNIDTQKATFSSEEVALITKILEGIACLCSCL